MAARTLPELILARHGESEASKAGVLNGVPEAGVALTAEGRRQATLLGELLRGDAGAGPEPALVVATAFPRTQETAALAVSGAPHLLLPGLNDPRFGAWEGRPLEEYRTWALVAPPTEPCPGGGESRTEVAGRVAAAARALLERPEPAVLVVAHSLSIRYLLDAADGLVPAAKAERVPYAEPFRLTGATVAAAVALLEAWVAAPRWRS
jgi:broad specificity phosphatase PhoE